MLTRRSLAGLAVSLVALFAAPVFVHAAEPATLTVASPLDMQVFQRQTAAAGPVVIAGHAPVDADAVRYRVTGTSAFGTIDHDWHVIKPLNAGAFGITANLPAGGWYSLEIQATDHGKPAGSAAVQKFGVGEVFVIAGQSNSTNYGQYRTKSTSGMVASFDGKTWTLADDPMRGTHDHSGGGSPWPSFGDAMFARYHVPIAVASTGHGGTSVLAWQPVIKSKPGPLYTWMMTRIKALGPHGFRAVLWHQGESDCKGRTTDQYVEYLTRVIETSKKDAGWDFPWIVAKATYHVGHPEYPEIRAAFQKIWDTHVALPGPDTDTLGPEYRDHHGKGIHMNPKGLKKHGEMWAQQVGLYLDPLLK